MGQKFTEASKNLKKLMQDPKKSRALQSGIGITIFGIFVLSSVVVNQSIQAANQAAGNYGYYSGTYGYNASTTSSDKAPSAPTALTMSSVTTTAATVSWTAPTTTTTGTLIATGSGSIRSYLINYGTTSLSTCSGGTSTTSTSATTSLTGLTQNTLYYFAVCAEDNNFNNSTALTGSFSTLATGAGSGGSGGGSSGTSSGSSSGATFPTGSTTAATGTTGASAATVVAPITTPSVGLETVQNAAQLVATLGVARDTSAESANTAKITSSSTQFQVTLGADVKTVAANFVTYGTSNAAVHALGSGERLAVVRDLLETLGSAVQSDAGKFLLAAEQISNGQKPTVRNLTKEVAQAGLARDAFRKLTGKSAPDFKNAKEDLAWNTMLYRIRFRRDLVKERMGIGQFRVVFKRLPTSPLDWASVRAYGYALK